MYTLKNSFDIYITDKCNLHCQGCIVLDYKDKGNVLKEGKYTLSDLKTITKRLNDFSFELPEVKLIGGEPTIHPQFNEMVRHIVDSEVYKKTAVVTNGLNFTKPVVESLKLVDRVVISVYPIMENYRDVLEKSKLYQELVYNDVEIEYWVNNTFFEYGTEAPAWNYSAKENWRRCYQKKSCQVITKSEVYRCAISHSEGVEGVSLSDRNKIIELNTRNKPLELCKKCPWPAKQHFWRTLNSKNDTRVTKRGLKLLGEY